MLRIAIPHVLRTAGLTILVLFSVATSKADPPIWAKKGVSFMVRCFSDSFEDCKPLRIPSPDGKNSVDVSYATLAGHPDIEVASLRVTTLGTKIADVQPVADVQEELVWSPDSKAFYINGNNNGYDDYHVAFFRLKGLDLGPAHVTATVEQDMVRTFPPCEAKDPIDNCADLAAKPDDFICIAAIDWIGDSSRMVVMAEVPCSSSVGGIMCQVLGYEIEVPSGKILRRMQPKEFARVWQHSMAWKFHDPGPPEFKTKTPSTSN